MKVTVEQGNGTLSFLMIFGALLKLKKFTHDLCDFLQLTCKVRISRKNLDCE